MPNVNLPNLNMPGVNATVPNLNNGLNTGLPNVATPPLGNTSIPSNGLSMPNTSTGINTNTSGLTNDLLPSGEVQNLEKDASQLTKATGELSQAEKGIQNVNTATLEKDAENFGQMKQLNGEIMKADQYQKMVEKWESESGIPKRNGCNPSEATSDQSFCRK